MVIGYADSENDIANSSADFYVAKQTLPAKEALLYLFTERSHVYVIANILRGRCPSSSVT